jgi:hypothetical protein
VQSTSLNATRSISFFLYVASEAHVLNVDLHEKPCFSEAKGSFALAPSPHGDSVESSGPNMADNLLLLDGDNSNPGSSLEKRNNVENRNGNGNNSREQEEPCILRFARRNRSRPANNAVRLAILPSKDASKPCTNETSKDMQPEEEKEKDKGDPKLASPVSNDKPGSPRKSETTLRTVQPEEVGTEREAGPTQMDVDAITEEAETPNIEKLSGKAEALTGPSGNEKEVVNMHADVSNLTNARCNDEITAPSALLNDDSTDRKGVPPSNSRCNDEIAADNGLIENEGSGTAMETHAEEMDSKVVQLGPSDLVEVQIKDDKEEDIMLEKPSNSEATAEVESKEDSRMAEPALDSVVVVPRPPESEVVAAAAGPTAEEAKVVLEHEDEILEKARIVEVFPSCPFLTFNY